MTIVHHRPYNGGRRRSLLQTSGAAETGASVDFPNAGKGLTASAAWPLLGPILPPAVVPKWEPLTSCRTDLNVPIL